MNELSDLSSRCQKAVDSDNLEELSKYLLRLQQLMPQRDFTESFMPQMLIKAARGRRFECYEYLLPRTTHFTGFEMRGVYYQLFQQNRTDLVPGFLKQCEKYSPTAEFKTYLTDYTLENAVKTGKVEFIAKAVKRGADIHKARYMHYSSYNNYASLYVCLAIEHNQPGALVALLERGAKGGMDGHDLAGFISDPALKDPKRYIEILLDYGFLKPTASLREDMVHGLRYGRTVTPHTLLDLQNTLTRWQMRGEYRKFPATFKEGVRLEDLRASYQGGPAYRLTSFHGLAAADRFDEAAQIAKRTGASMRLSYLLDKDSYGNRVIDILGARGQLDILNDPALWKDNVADFFEMVRALPPVYRKQVNISAMKNAFLEDRLHKTSKGSPALKRRPKR